MGVNFEELFEQTVATKEKEKLEESVFYEYPNEKEKLQYLLKKVNNRLKKEEEKGREEIKEAEKEDIKEEEK